MEVESNTSKKISQRLVFRSFICFFVLNIIQSPGRISADTKLDLAINPEGFLYRALHLWSSVLPLGQVQNQAYGYFFPQGLFYAITHVCGIPAWIAQRLWWSILITIGFIGFIALAQALKIGTRYAQYVAGLVYVASPRVLSTLASISSEALPYFLAPWLLYGVVIAIIPYSALGNNAARLSCDGRLWRIAALTSTAFALTGAVNALASIAALSPAIIWLFLHRQDRRWKIFTKWWIGTGIAVSLWWLIPLWELAKISPPFLDYIESSAVTTKWNSLTEVLRGTSTWSPYVSSLRPMGYLCTTHWMEVLTTGLLAACGLAGLGMRDMPHQRKLIALCVSGLLIYGVGFCGPEGFYAGSPFSALVHNFLDGQGKVLRNVHKFEPLLRLPIDLGICHLVGKAETLLLACVKQEPACVKHEPACVKQEPYGLQKIFGLFSQTVSPLVSFLIMIPTVLLLSLLPLSNSLLLSENSFTKIPQYWQQTANWLKNHDRGGRALVVPGAPFADQRWGYTSDFPLQVLSRTPWAIRDAIPLTPPGAIRFLDSLEQILETGYAAPGLADTLAAAGFSHVVVAGDYDTSHARSLTPFLALQTLKLSPGFSLSAQFGVSSPRIMKNFIVNDGLEVATPAVSIFAIHSTSFTPINSMHIIPVDQLRQIKAGAEGITSINQSAALMGIGPINATNLIADIGSQTLGAVPLIVTDTPLLRETDYGRVFDNKSAILSPRDSPRVFNARTDYDTPGGLPNKVIGQWEGGIVSVSSSASDATQLGKVLISHSPAAAFDHNPNTSWMSRNLSSAVGQWMKITFAHPRTVLIRLTTAQVLGPDVTAVKVTTDTGSAYTQGLSPHKAVALTVPAGATSSITITAVNTTNNSTGNQFGISELVITDAHTVREIPIGYRIVMPEISPGTHVSDWILTPISPGRSECVTTNPHAIVCSESLGASPAESERLQRLLSVPADVRVVPNIFVRSINSSALNNLLSAWDITVIARSHISDPRGNTLAVIDGDTRTSWTGTYGEQFTGISGINTGWINNRIELHSATEHTIDRMRLVFSSANTPANITQVAINLGKGRLIRTVRSGQWIYLPPTRTRTITVIPLKWYKKTNINELGFPSALAPGLAEITLGNQSELLVNNINPHQVLSVDCAHGPVIMVGDQLVHFSVSATREQLREHTAIRATMCDVGSILALPQGRVNVEAHSAAPFAIAGIELHDLAVPPAFSLYTPQSVSSSIWNSHQRDIDLPYSDQARVIYLPESINSGWHAAIATMPLHPISINGWEQGWYIPANYAGKVQIRFVLDRPYRSAIIIGLPLVALVAIVSLCPYNIPLGWLPRSSQQYVLARRTTRCPSLRIPRWLYYSGYLFIGVALASWCGGIIFLTLLLLSWELYRLERKSIIPRSVPRLLSIAAPTLILMSYMVAVVLLSHHPWHSGREYAADSVYPQIFSCIAVAFLLLASLFPFSAPESSSNGIVDTVK